VDVRPGVQRVALRGDALWRREFGGDPAVVGKPILMGGAPWTGVGVMGPGCALPDQKAERFVPLWVAYPKAAPEGGVHFVRPVFRLKPGVSTAAAVADLDAAFRELARLHPESDQDLEDALH